MFALVLFELDNSPCVHYYALLFSLYKSTTQKANKISQAKLWKSPSLLGNEYESGL